MVTYGNISFVKRAHIQKLASRLALFYLSGKKTVVWKLREDEGGIKVPISQCQITQGSG